MIVLPIAYAGGVMIEIRRWHDMNLSGWCVLIFVIAACVNLKFALLIWLFLLFRRGTSGPNRYGEDPLGQPIQE